MEVVEEPVFNSTVDNPKLNKVDENNVEVVETDVCHKSNGVDCDKKIEVQRAEESCDNSESNTVANNCDSSKNVTNEEPPENNEINKAVSSDECSAVNTSAPEVVESTIENVLDSQHEAEATEEIEISSETIIETVEKETCESEIITETIVEINNLDYTTTSDQVKFETEIFVEENDNDLNENIMINSQENDTTNNILSELGPNIELSEVLRSSDISENNNSSVRQEVFNKEELLDILEGNDINEPVASVNKYGGNKIIEAQIALQQLSRLNKKRKPKTKKVDKKSANIELLKSEPKNPPEKDKSVGEIVQSKKIVDNKTATPTENIVNVLVMDWQDDEPVESSSSNVAVENSNTEHVEETQEKITHTEEITETTSVDSTLSEDQSHKSGKSGDESAPRRLSRVIKKKVIFDPDNPDTFTKGKLTTKTKDVQVVKDQTPSKKIKIEETSQRSSSKSPLSKLQWKKPTPKNSKQCKRLSEVDKLLMDEGAVNMIYQLTPEAPKGRKNMRTKAEFIKKIQSSTPDGKEMKFRERKKESLKYEDGEAKHISGGKHRTSLGGSVKSPSQSEDFETHSADDSIIYRRHSSSSYSSSCMSPRRLSDVEVGVASRSSHQVSADIQNKIDTKSDETEGQLKDGLKNETANLSSDIINKDDCLSIKEKLNSKLSLALSKRKRESSKIDKPIKQKKILKTEDNSAQVYMDQFKYISIIIDQRLAVISVKKLGTKICVQVIKELGEAFKYVDSKKDISTTLLDSKCGTLCSSLNLSLLLDDDKEIRFNHAYELAESVRSLLSAVSNHSKLLCCGVRGACEGVSLSLTALSDMALCAEGASFSLSAAVPLPGTTVLTRRHLPQVLVNDLVIFGRQISASQALQVGLISRILWPDRFDEQIHSIAKDIAAQPLQAILLKKKLLCLKKTREADTTFLSCLEAERDLLVEYWISSEGQELLRTNLDEA